MRSRGFRTVQSSSLSARDAGHRWQFDPLRLPRRLGGGRFKDLIAAGPAGRPVANWQCLRGTTYMYPGSLTESAANTHAAQGFEIAAHPQKGCGNFTSPANLEATYFDASGDRVVGDSHYIQYRVELTSSHGGKAPVLTAIGFTHNGNLPGSNGEIGGVHD
jgi:hypothetical protein